MNFDPELGSTLNAVFDRYNRAGFLESDPVQFLHRYPGERDREVIALVSAAVAYGRASLICRSIQSLIERMERSLLTPQAWALEVAQEFKKAKLHVSLRGFVHRMHTGKDIALLMVLLTEQWSRLGSLRELFLRTGWDGADWCAERALESAVGTLKKRAKNLGAGSALLAFLAVPSGGSACKRWCMFLRWMVRDDAVDPGAWSKQDHRFSASGLVIPLDTHLSRISQLLGLTARRVPDWRAAQEVTHALKVLDPRDPTRYDFAVSRLGIIEGCRGSYVRSICEKCELRPVCTAASNQ